MPVRDDTRLDRPVDVSSHAGDGYSWTMAHALPHPGLAGVVDGTYCGYAERSDAPFRRREAATGRVTLIISFGDPIDVVEMSQSTSAGRRLTSFVAGLHEGYAVTRYRGSQAGVQVDLTPLGAGRLLGAPREVANECVPLDDVLGRFAGELAERMAGAGGWAERFAVLDGALLGRLVDSPDPDPAIAWAWSQLARSHGRVPVHVLAEEIGWSRRHFGVRFRDQVGLPPKPAGRVLRFRRAAQLLASGPVRSIADVAAACGYADHSHLVREFRALAGCSPSEYVDALLPAGGGVGAEAGGG
ncbi:MAG TPA: helix-turn-helix domain-containing protein [Acidimicrobiales bacterium]